MYSYTVPELELELLVVVPPCLELSLHAVHILLEEIHELAEGVGWAGEGLYRGSQPLHLPLYRLPVPRPPNLTNAGLSLLNDNVCKIGLT